MPGSWALSTGRRIGLPLIAGALIFGVAWATIAFTRGDELITRIWLANAVAAAILLRSPRQAWPGLITAIFAAFIASHLVEGDRVGDTVALAGLKLAEVLIVAIPMRRRFGVGIDLGALRPLGLFLPLAGLIAPLTVGFAAALYFRMTAGAPFVPMLEQWVVCHALGFLILTPLLMAIPDRISAGSFRWRALLEPALIVAGTAAITLFVFTQHVPVLVVVMPCLLLAAFRLPVGWAALAIVVVAGEAIALTGLGSGPIASSGADPAVQLVTLQVFIAVAVLVTLPVSAVIGERNRLLVAEISARGAAEAAATGKSRFVATMSHEIRTPMTGVLGMIELLRGDPEAGDRERYLATLKQSADILMTVLDDVLDFSKIEAGKLVLDERSFDIGELAQAIVTLYSQAASRKGLLLALSVDRSGPLRVHGDPVRLQQVISNLVSNAIKFTNQGQVTLAVRALGSPSKGTLRWRIEVRDTGVGIPEDQRASLFEPFVQSELTIKRQQGGTGLGLAISQRLAEAMGGTLGLHSKLGEGSTFWFEFELEASKQPAPSPVAQVARAATENSRQLSVLVAEDNPTNSLLIDAMLKQMGHRPTFVENGVMAVEAAAKARFDCILMDMQMPEMDGLAATRAIRASGGPCAEVPIIALTADASPERRRFYDNAGLTEFLAKPIDPAALEQALQEISGRSGPGPRKRRALPISAAIRSAYAERKREALAIADEAAAELVDCSTSRAEAAIAKVAGIAHQLAGSAGSLGEAELGDVAADVDGRLRAACADDRRVIAEAIADLRAALGESDIPAQARRNVQLRSRVRKG